MPNMFGGDQMDEDYAPVQHQEAIERAKRKQEEQAKRKISERFRSPGKIVAVATGYDHDRCCNHVSITVEDTTGVQAISLLFNNQQGYLLYQKWIDQICTLFGVNHINKVLHKTCFVLRCFEENNCPIEGFEVDGRRLTHTGFLRRHSKDPGTVLEREQNRLRGEVQWAQRRKEEAEKRLTEVTNDYVDWEV
jgi:hypothetical protein